MRISDLVKKFGCTRVTIQHYERLGLLPEPERTSGNYRTYTQVHVELLSFIRLCRMNHIPLDDIKQLLNTNEQPEAGPVAQKLAERHICDLGEKINAMQSLLMQLNSIRLTGRLSLPA